MSTNLGMREHALSAMHNANASHLRHACSAACAQLMRGISVELSELGKTISCADLQRNESRMHGW
jgi:hypothetical protein